jgi:MFS family permease
MPQSTQEAIINHVTEESIVQTKSNTTPFLIRKARWAASAMFMLHGAAFGTWAALLPTFKSSFGLNDESLGMAMLSLIIASLIAMPLTGRALAKWGSPAVLLWSSIFYSLSLFSMAFVPNLELLVITSFIFGLFKGSMDVAVNAQAIPVENQYHKPIMSMFQATWSVGGLLASLYISSALHLQLSINAIAISISVVLLALGIFSSRSLLSDIKKKEAENSKFQWPSPTLLKIGFITFLVLYTEGAMMNWSAVYARSVAHATADIAPGAFAALSFMMALGRFTGDGIIAKYGRLTVFKWGASLIALGILLVSTVQVWPVTFLGFGLAGLGLSNLYPILLGAAGRTEEGAGPGIAAIATIGFLGYLAGPPLIASLSHALGLPIAISTVTIFGVLAGVLGTGILKPLLGKLNLR